MNRLVPHRPRHVRIRRHIGSLPHGLPTALVFGASVIALLVSSVLVVDRAVPALLRSQRDAAVAVPGETPTAQPTDSSRDETPAVTAIASPPPATHQTTVLVRAHGGPGSGGTTPQPASNGPGGASANGDEATPRPTATNEGGGGWDHDGVQPTPTPSPRNRDEEDPSATPPAAAPGPTATPRPRSTPRPTPTPRPTQAPGPDPTPTPGPDPTPTPEPQP